MAGLDPWRTLGIAHGASKVEIRKAYRRLARRYHPDLNPADPEADERFKEVQAAYEVLTGRQAGMAPRYDPSHVDRDPQHRTFSENDDPFLSILAAYLRHRRGGEQ